MQVAELKNEGLKREFKVTLHAADISKKVDARLANLAKRVKVPGFRAGKVPLNIVKKKHGREVFGEVLELTVAESTQAIIKERNLVPALEPKIAIDSFGENQDLIYNVTIEIYPQVPEIDYSKIKLTRAKVEVSEKDIQDSLERLRSAQKTFKPLEKARAAKKGDVVVIDFEGSIDGKKFEGGTAADYKLELGSGSFISGFEDQLEGTKKGDKVDVKVTFPEDYGSPELAGKKAVFAVTVNDILQTELPEVNDEMATKFGLENLDKLKEAITKQIEADFENIAKVKLKKELFDKLDKELLFEVPEGMVELELNSLLQSDTDKLEAGSKEEKERNKEYRELSVRRVKLGILLAELGKLNSISITEDELRKAIFDQVRRYPGQEQRVIEFYQKNKEARDQLKGPILEEKVVDHILSKASITDKKTSTKELLAFNAE